MTFVKATSTSNNSDTSGKRSSVSVRKGNKKLRSATQQLIQDEVEPQTGVSTVEALMMNMLQEKVNALTKWQLYVQQDMSAIRQECMTVRRELAKVETYATESREKIESSLESLKLWKEETISNIQAQLNVNMLSNTVKTDEWKDENMKIHKLLGHMDSQLQLYGSTAIDEDCLITQLTEVQEKLDQDLARIKTTIEYQINSKFQSTESISHTIKLLQNQLTEEKEERQNYFSTLRAKGQSNNNQPNDIQCLDVRLAKRLKAVEDKLNAVETEHQDLRMDVNKSMVVMQDNFRNYEVKYDREDTLAERYHTPGGRDEQYRLIVEDQIRDIHERLVDINQSIHHFEHNTHLRLKAFDRTIFDVQSIQKGITEQLRNDYILFDKNLNDLSYRAGRDFAHISDELNILHRESRVNMDENQKLKNVIFDLTQDLREFRSHMMRTLNEKLQHWNNRDNGNDHECDNFQVSPNIENSTIYRQMRRYNTISVETPTNWCKSTGVNTDSDIASVTVGQSEKISNTAVEAPRQSDCREMPMAIELNKPATATGSTLQCSGGSTSSTETYEPRRNRNPKPTHLHEVIVVDDEDSESDSQMHESSDVAQVFDYASPSCQEHTVILENQSCLDRVTRLQDVQFGAQLYFCFGGAPSLNSKYVNSFSKLSKQDSLSTERLMQFQNSYPAFAEFPIYLTQFTIRSIHTDLDLSLHLNSRCIATSNRSGQSPDSWDASMISFQSINLEFSKVVQAYRMVWLEQLTKQLNQAIMENDTVSQFGVHNEADLLSFTTSPAFLNSDQSPSVEEMTKWRRQQAKCMHKLAKLMNHVIAAEKMSADDVAFVSPGVFLFSILFDPLEVVRRAPQRGNFRLNAYGKYLVDHLWKKLLQSLPYMLFVDCPWLEQQQENGAIPPLGICHLLSVILAGNSLCQNYAICDGTDSIDPIEKAMSLLMSMMRVNGEGVLTPGHQLANVEVGSKTAPVSLELLAVDNKFVEVLELDGFFEVTSEISRSTL